jgi:hypothetical protein
MRAPLDLRRLLLLAMLLPQLIVLGLGREVFVCIAADGHVEVELASSACCTGPDAAAETAGALPDEGESCGSCSDYGIGVEPRIARASTEDEVNVPPHVAATPAALAPPVVPDALDEARHAAHERPARGADPSPHLVHVRITVLRC